MPRFGDEKWQVEWVSELAFYDDSEEVDRDNCKSSYKAFKIKETALEFAKKIWPETTNKFGIVEIDHLRYVSLEDEEFPWLGEWIYLDETLIISDESGIPE